LIKYNKSSWDKTDMRIESFFDKSSVVLIGSFNPKIFHPSWLALYGMISREQADDAELKFVLPEIAEFTVAYMNFLVQTNRFQVKCDAIHKDIIKDVVIASFGEHLHYTPVWQLGINRSIAFSCGSEEIRDKLGKKLAPTEPWGPWGKEIERSRISAKEHGGMMRLTMLQRPRPDGLRGHVQVDLRPASDDLSAVILDVNNHFTFGNAEDETMGCQEALDILRDRWQDSMNGAEDIADGRMATVEKL
jgi:hypothetical protein